MINSILLLQLVASVGMAAVIWFVQIAHYPLHFHVPADASAAYQQSHMYRVTFIVGPLMLTETIAATWLLFLPLPCELADLAWIGFILVVLVWISTAVWQVPCHRRLEVGRDEKALRKLILTNWVRTALWTARSVVACAMVWPLLSGTTTL